MQNKASLVEARIDYALSVSAHLPGRTCHKGVSQVLLRDKVEFKYLAQTESRIAIELTSR